MASSGDSAAAKRAAGQLQQNLGEMHGHDALNAQGDKEAQVGKGTQDADKRPDTVGMTDALGAKDQVKEQTGQQ